MLTRTLLLLSLLAGTLAAQSPYGRISGRVTDTTGAAVAGATVRAINAETNVAVSATTNAEGNYDLANVPIGQYRLEAQQTGFKQYSRAGVEVRVSDSLGIDIALEVGAVSESINVTAESPLLESTTADMGQVVDNRRIVDLPLAGGNPMYLTQMAPGVVQTTSPGHGWLPQATGPTSNAVVAGTKNGSSEFTIDGIPNMSRGGQIAFSPPPEMIQEFRVQTVPFDASSGHFTGAAVTMVLKSGTNDPHGTLFFSHLSRPLMTHPFFVNRSIYDTRTGPVTKAKEDLFWPYVRTNRYRATFGGPVYIPKVYDGRNRTFWTFGFDWLDRMRPEQQFFTVPTAAERAGNFSNLLALGSQYQIYDPATIKPQGARFSRSPFPGNIIPASRISPMAAGLVNYYPLPNVAGAADGGDNYFDPRVRTIDYKSQIARIDHQFNDNHRIYGSLSMFQSSEQWGNAFHNAASGIQDERAHHALAIDDVRTLSPTTVLDLRYGFIRLVDDRGPQVAPFDLTGIGFPTSLTSQLDAGFTTFPNVTVDGKSMSPLGGTNLEKTRTTRHVFSSAVSRLQGNHSLRFGGEFRIFQANDASLGNVSPALTFGQTWTKGPLDSSPAAAIGQGMASLLLGLPTGGSIDKSDTLALSSNFGALFLQDDWRVSSRLTLNVGVRWEVERPLRERYNRMNRGFDFTAANPVQAQALANYAAHPIPELPASQFQVPGGILFAGVNGVPGAIRDTDWNNLAPRIGLAYKVGQKTVIRAGYGIFFDTINEDPDIAYQQGFSQSTALTPSLDNGQTFRATLANPFPDGLLASPGASSGLRTFLGQAVNFVSPTEKPAYMQRWTFNIQHQLPHQVLVEIGYMGNRATGLPIQQEYDNTPASYLSTSPERDQGVINFLTEQVANPFYGIPDFQGSSLQAKTVRRAQLLTPMPEFASVTTNIAAGSSWYHALTVRADKRMANGLSLQAGYTFSRTMEAIQLLNPTDASPVHQVSQLDRPHRFTASGIYELPVGKGRHWGSAAPGWLDAFVGGWSMQGIYMYQTGYPFNFGNVLFRGDIKDIPIAAGEQQVEHWFNTSGFERDAKQQLQYNLRTFPFRLSGVRTSGFNNVDFSAFKNFRIAERWRLQFRGEAQNAMNHPIFNVAPNTTPTAALFGQINNGDAEQRRITLALKLIW